MALPLEKMAPTAVVICAVGYFYWPYLGQSTAAPVAAAPKLPEITATLLSPIIAPAPDRDPFGTTSQAYMDVPEEVDTATKTTVGPPGTAAPRTGQGSAPGASGTAPAGKGGSPAVKKLDLLSGLVLNATYIQGDLRVAIINDRPYAQGESLSVANSTSAPHIVAQIHPHKVLITCQGQSAELTYSDPTRPSNPSPPPPDSVDPSQLATPVPLNVAQNTLRTEAAKQPETSEPSPAIAKSDAGSEGEALHE